MNHMIEGRWDEIRPMHQQELDRTLVVEMTIETASAKIRDVENPKNPIVQIIIKTLVLISFSPGNSCYSYPQWWGLQLRL